MNIRNNKMKLFSTFSFKLILKLLVIVTFLKFDVASSKRLSKIVTPNTKNIWRISQAGDEMPISWECETSCLGWNVSLREYQGHHVQTFPVQFEKHTSPYFWYMPVTRDIPEGIFMVVATPDRASDPKNCDVQEARGQLFRIQHSDENNFIIPKQLSGDEQLKFRRDERINRILEINHRMPISELWPPKSECGIERLTTPSTEAMHERMAAGRPFILEGMMKDWHAMKFWDFNEFERLKLLDAGIKLPFIPGKLASYAKWNAFRKTCDASRVEHNYQTNVLDFFRMYPDFKNHLGDTEKLLDTTNFLLLLDEDIFEPNVMEWCPVKSGSFWQVNNFNASLLIAQIKGHRRIALFPKEIHMVPGVLHNDYADRHHDGMIGGLPFWWWRYTYPALNESSRPALECVLQPGDMMYIPSGTWYSELCISDNMAVKYHMCTPYDIRACLDEMRAQSDTSNDNHLGTYLVQLKEKLKGAYSEYITHEDEEFVPPSVGDGPSRQELIFELEDFVSRKIYKEVSLGKEEVEKRRLERNSKYPDIDSDPRADDDDEHDDHDEL